MELVFSTSSRAPSVESITFIKSHSVVNATLHIWLNNTVSFLIAAAFIIIHPALGVFAVVSASISSGELLASWQAGYCSTAHFAYGVAETQAYILLWLAVVKTYYAQQRCSDITCRWSATIKHTTRLLVYVFTAFLLLAIVEAAEAVDLVRSTPLHKLVVGLGTVLIIVVLIKTTNTLPSNGLPRIILSTLGATMLYVSVALASAIHRSYSARHDSPEDVGNRSQRSHTSYADVPSTSSQC